VILDLNLSFSTGTFSQRPLEQNLAEIKKLGFENIEFNMKSVQTEDDTSIYAAEKLMHAYGLKCLTVHAATLPVKDSVEVHRAVYYGKISADFAHRLGAPIMVIHSNVSRRLPSEKRNLLLKRIFREIKPYAESLNLKLALENLSYASMGFGKNVAELEEVFEVIDGGNMGVTLDFCHATATGVTQNLLEKYHKRLFNVHMSNRAHKPYYKETPQLKDFIEKLSRYLYKRSITLELSRKCTLPEIRSTKAVLETVISKIGL
jgi:sugar phosphate isomerase/epimerase